MRHDPQSTVKLQRMAVPVALALSALLGACDPTQPEPPLPRTATAVSSPLPAVPVTTGAPVRDPSVQDLSVPDAKTTLAKEGAKAGASTDNSSAESSMTPTQESTKMPLPGQANDHSLPSTEKRAGQVDAAASAASTAAPR